MTSAGSDGNKDVRVAYGVVVVNDHNEVLMLRSLDPEILPHDKWIIPTGWVQPGEEIVETIIKGIKEGTQVEIEMDGTLEPFEKIEIDDGELSDHVVVLGFLARSRSDIRDLGDNVQTAGWFTPQEVRWYWDKIAQESRKLLVTSNYIMDTE